MLKQIAIYMSVCLSVCLAEVSVKIIDKEAMLNTIIPEPRGALEIPFAVYFQYQRAGYDLLFVTDSEPKKNHWIKSSSVRDLWSSIGNHGPYGNEYFKNKKDGYYYQDIYLTDLHTTDKGPQHYGKIGDNPDNRPVYTDGTSPKMILKFQIEGIRLTYGPATLKEILISSALEAKEVPQAIKTIVEQIRYLYGEWSDGDMKATLETIQGKIAQFALTLGDEQENLKRCLAVIDQKIKP